MAAQAGAGGGAGGSSSIMEIAPGIYGYSRTVPAEYKTITRRVLSNAASTSQTVIPAEYKTITSRQMVSAGSVTDFREVLCESDMTSSTISKIQRALQAAGYDPGPIDNVMGGKTRDALRAYQEANGLEVSVQGNNIPLETLKSLGVY